VRSFLAAGGDVLQLVEGEKDFVADLLPGAPARMETNTSWRFSLAPGKPATRGLSQADLVMIKNHNFPIFTQGGEALAEPGVLRELRHGKGRLILAPLIDVEQHKGTWSAEKIERFYSVLLTNLGVRQGAVNLNFAAFGADAAAEEQVVAWDFEQGAAGWEGTVTTDKAHGGKTSLKPLPIAGEGWDKGAIELEAAAGQQLLKLPSQPVLEFYCLADDAVFAVAALDIGGVKKVFETRTAAGEWTRIRVPIEHMDGPKTPLDGKALTQLRIFWGGIEDGARKIEVYFDDISIRSARKSMFKRYVDVPTYDPNVYITW
jgi:hypothetical protein